MKNHTIETLKEAAKFLSEYSAEGINPDNILCNLWEAIRNEEEKFIDVDNVIDAVSIGSQTCVGGCESDFPRTRGNCFSIGTADKKFYRVVNFRVENLEELLKRGTISWPVKIIPVGRVCFIHDTRIPHDWYTSDVCSICAPEALQNVPYMLKRQRDIETGALKITKCAGFNIESREIKATTRKLKLNWTLDGENIK